MTFKSLFSIALLLPLCFVLLKTLIKMYEVVFADRHTFVVVNLLCKSVQ